MGIDFTLVDTSDHKLINNIFRGGRCVIVAFPATGEAIAYFVEEVRKLAIRNPQTGEMLRLPNVEFKGDASMIVRRFNTRLQLKKRYPNCRVRLIEADRRSATYPGHTIVRAVCEFIGDHSLYPLAFLKPKPNGNANPTR